MALPSVLAYSGSACSSGYPGICWKQGNIPDRGLKSVFQSTIPSGIKNQQNKSGAVDAT